MSEDASMLPQPTDEHRKITESAGVWNVDCEYYMDPTQPAMKMTAKETVEAHGAFFAISLFEADFMGMPFQGRATLGYQPHTQQWVSTWIDSMTPHLFYFTGTFDGDKLVMTGKGPHPMTGELADYRTVEEHRADGSRVFDMFVAMGEDGAEVPMFHYVYTRAN